MKTIEQINAEIAALEVEKERLLRGDDEIRNGDEVYWLTSEGDIPWRTYSNLYAKDLSQGNISKSRAWLEMIKRRREIETKMLKYADFDAVNKAYIYYDDKLDWGHAEHFIGLIPMSYKSAKRCLDEMNHDDLKFHLTWGRG